MVIPIPNPKAFISYSWSSAAYQAKVRDWAKRIAADGIEVVMDNFELREGHDKNAFMERMVTDATVTHVLLFIDKRYAEKADTRAAGVGTESQIISQEVYAKVAQSKFIPIFCEVSQTGEPILPVFLKGRIGIDFSSEEMVNKNWEQLVRLLYGKPLFEKPLVGKAPDYITADSSAPAAPFLGKLSVLRQASLHGQRNLKPYRRDFLNSAISYADALRIRSEPDPKKIPERTLEVFRQLIPVRNALCDWVLFESETNDESFGDALIGILEQVLELKSRPPEITQWNEGWFAAHGAFAYETFLYIVAALLKTEAFAILNRVLFGHYIKPESMRHGQSEFVGFDAFYGYLDNIGRLLDDKLKYHSQLVELIKRNADRTDLPFAALLEADALCLLASILRDDSDWYPQTFYYISYGRSFPFFTRLAQRRHFAKLAIITGIALDELKAKVTAGIENVRKRPMNRFDASPVGVLNLEKWNTLS